MDSIINLLTELAHARGEFFSTPLHSQRFFDNEMLYLDIIRSIIIRDRTSQTNQALRGLMSLMIPATMEDVPVIPSRAQIDARTTNVANTGEVCAICQSVMDLNSGVEARIHCGHHFHRNCIEQWFRQSARCPICRNDIRETGSNVTNEDLRVNANSQQTTGLGNLQNMSSTPNGFTRQHSMDNRR